MLIRNTLIVAGASFALAVGCFAGVAAIAGPEIMKNGWTWPIDSDGETVVFRQGGKVIRTSRETTTRVDTTIVDRTFAWTGKDQLTVDLPVDVVFVQGAEAKVVASGPKAYIDRLRVEGDRVWLNDDDNGQHGAVTLDYRGIRFESDSERMKITVIAPDVTKFDVRGSGDLDIRKYDHPTFAVSASGSGGVEASGRVDTIAVEGSGPGYVDLAGLKAKDAVVAVSGSGGGAIFATNKAKVDISGSGDVELRTEPKSVSSEITGSGEVRREY
ncbi:GIN domain-containing protein [Caulobacter segnis]